MGISAAKLVYDFERKINGVNGGRDSKYRIVDIVNYLNEAQEVWFENKMLVKDTNNRVRNDLRVFEVKKEELDCEEVDCNCCKADYPENFYELSNQIAKVCGVGDCEGVNKEIIIRMTQGDDLQEARKNPYRQGNFKWEQLPGDEAGNSLYVYHEGDMKVSKVCVDYYRKPKRIEAPKLVECGDFVYENWDRDLISKNCDFEVDGTYANNQVTDLAVLFASRDRHDVQGFQTQLQKQLQIQNLYK